MAAVARLSPSCSPLRLPLVHALVFQFFLVCARGESVASGPRYLHCWLTRCSISVHADARSFSELVVQAFPSLASSKRRVVGLKQEDGTVLLPAVVLRTPSAFHNQRLTIVLDRGPRLWKVFDFAVVLMCGGGLAVGRITERQWVDVEAPPPPHHAYITLAP